MRYNSVFQNIIRSFVFLCGLVLFSGGRIMGQPSNAPENPPRQDDVTKETECAKPASRFIHKLTAEIRPAYIAPTHDFLRGKNYTWKPIETSVSCHLKYAFQCKPNTEKGRAYNSVYQGVGVAGYSFAEPEQLGRPFVIYLLQGARITLLGPQLSFNYEWNFGLSFGWKPFGEFNEYNMVIGSRVNAYINANFYLNWMLSRQIDLMAGISMAHFSNGNTHLPNAGLNTLGLKFGMVYNFGREQAQFFPRALPPGLFKRHMTYDLTLFGAWRVKGIYREPDMLIVPRQNVFGFNFSPMYNLGYKFRAGASLDGVYDGTANVGIEWDPEQGRDVFVFPAKYKQMALGVSARAEYVMPYFTVTFGLGANLIYGCKELRTFYQMLALKVAVTRHSFLHIGYSLRQFQTPNFLMLGIGYRFNSRPRS